MAENTHEHSHDSEYGKTKDSAVLHVHEHTGADDHTHDEYAQSSAHPHAQNDMDLAHRHGHYHSPEHKKKLLNRLARIIGHLQKVKDMVENDEDCADILMQLSAVNSAVRSTGKVIINEHITHCLIHAMEDGDDKSIEDFQKAIERFL